MGHPLGGNSSEVVAHDLQPSRYALGVRCTSPRHPELPRITTGLLVYWSTGLTGLVVLGP